MLKADNRYNISFLSASVIALVIFLFQIPAYTLIDNLISKTIFINVYEIVVNFIVLFVLFDTAKKCNNESKISAKTWYLFSFGFLSYNLGNIIWAVQEISSLKAPVPSPADAAFLISYIIISWGILTLPQKKIEKGERLNFFLDIGIVFLSAFFLAVLFVFSGAYLFSDKAVTPDLLTIIISIIYPVFDLIIIWTIFIYIFRYKKTPQTGVLIIILLSFAILTFSDLFLNYSITAGIYFPGGLYDYGYVLSTLLLGLAAMLKVQSLYRPSDGRTSTGHDSVYYKYFITYLPYFWIIVTFIVLVLVYNKLNPTYSDICILFFAAILLLSILRQILTLTENIKLNAHLQKIVSARTAELTNANKILKSESEKLSSTYEKLISSELKYRSLVENSIQGIVIFQDGKIVFLNSACEKITGYNLKDFASFKTTDIIKYFSGESSALLAENLRKRKSGEKRKLNYQVQFYHKNGNVIWVDVYSALSQFNGREAIQLAFLEITERKLSEMVLQESEEKYRSLFESEIDAIGLFDSETMRIIDCNMSLLKLYGYSQEEVYNITGFDLSAEPEKSKTSILKTISQKQDKVNLIYHRKKDGTIFPVEIHSVFFTWKGKKIICGIFRDISERVESENKLKEFNEKLQESNKSKDRFFSIVAHDLRSPFHGLLGLSQLLCENYDEFEGKEIKDNLQLIRKAIKNVYNLLDNLLQWSRIQLGKIDFNPAVFDFYDSLNNAINIFQSKLNEKNIKVLNLIRAGTFVHADEKMTQSIIQNLLTNAIKFSHPDSTIKIESAVIDSMVSISIADEGVGIPAEAIPELFNIGSQYSTRGTNNEEGTGLGLILCRQLVEKNGGKIRAVSKKEIGSIFSFTLPSAGI